MGSDIGIDYYFEINTEEISDSTLVPLEQFKEKTSLEINKLADSSFALELEGRKMLIKPGERKAQINDTKIEMAAEALEVNDDLLISFDALEVLFEDYKERYIQETKIDSPEVDLDKPGFNLFLDPVEGEIGDDSLVVELILVNSSGRNQNLSFNTSQKYDLEIKDEEGRVHWRWSEGKAFAQVLQNLRIEPGEKEVWEVEIAIEDLAPGEYYLTGWIVGRRRDLTTAETRLIIKE